MDENEIYDLTNIGTLSAFAIVCIGVLVLRYKDPDRPRPFRVPFVWPVAIRRRRRVPLHHDRACRPRPGSGSASGSPSGCLLYFVLRHGSRTSESERVSCLACTTSRKPPPSAYKWLFGFSAEIPEQ